MEKKQYLSPKIEVNALQDEDIITSSLLKTEIDGKAEQTVIIGDFNISWFN